MFEMRPSTPVLSASQSPVPQPVPMWTGGSMITASAPMFPMVSQMPTPYPLSATPPPPTMMSPHQPAPTWTVTHYMQPQPHTVTQSPRTVTASPLSFLMQTATSSPGILENSIQGHAQSGGSNITTFSGSPISQHGNTSYRLRSRSAPLSNDGSFASPMQNLDTFPRSSPSSQSVTYLWSAPSNAGPLSAPPIVASSSNFIPYNPSPLQSVSTQAPSPPLSLPPGYLSAPVPVTTTTSTTPAPTVSPRPGPATAGAFVMTSAPSSSTSVLEAAPSNISRLSFGPVLPPTTPTTPQDNESSSPVTADGVPNAPPKPEMPPELANFWLNGPAILRQYFEQLSHQNDQLRVEMSRLGGEIAVVRAEMAALRTAFWAARERIPTPSE